MADPFGVKTVVLEVLEHDYVKSETGHTITSVDFNCWIHLFSKLHVTTAHSTFSITDSCYSVTSRHHKRSMVECNTRKPAE